MNNTISKKLIDKVILITGAGRGWGKAMTEAVARQGATVIAVARTKTELEVAVKNANKMHNLVEGYLADISDEKDMKNLFAHIITKYGKMDVLVNNAAILPLKQFNDFSVFEIDQVIKTNLRGPILGCYHAISIMEKNGGGSIINVSSAAGIRVLANESIYSVSKFGLEGFSNALAIELKEHNIAVNTLTPGGAIVKKHLKPTGLTEEKFGQMSKAHKQKFLDPILFTDAVIFLALQRGDGITGKRLISYELGNRIREEGWNLVFSDLIWNEENAGWM